MWLPQTVVPWRHYDSTVKDQHSVKGFCPKAKDNQRRTQYEYYSSAVSGSVECPPLMYFQKGFPEDSLPHPSA